ncbi:MAG: arginine repressor [Planctomycetes bacterium]|nr:arginine repressor [Planctomycetota bacterium]
MPSLLRRHQRIRELLDRAPVRSQEDLRRLLAADGLEVTQATLSRDLRELAVVKGPDGYRMPGADGAVAAAGDGLAQVLERELISAECGGTTVVLRTRPGYADSLAIEIDRVRPDEVLGTIAGDDTVFIAAKSPRLAQVLLRRMMKLAGRSDPAHGRHRRKRST